MKIVMRNLIYYCSLDNHKIGNLLAGACFYVGFSVTGRRIFGAVWTLRTFCNIEFWLGRRSTCVRCEPAGTRGPRPCWYNPRWNNPCNCTSDNPRPRDSSCAGSMAQRTRRTSCPSLCACTCGNSTCSVSIKTSARPGSPPLPGLGKKIDIQADSWTN